MMQNPPLRAILVEDDPAWQEIISEALRGLGLTLDIFPSLAEAIPALRGQPYHIAISDLSLAPGNPENTDGLQILAALQNSDNRCAAILLTGIGSLDIAVRALTDFNAYAFVHKEQFNPIEFTSTIQNIIKQRSVGWPEEKA